MTNSKVPQAACLMIPVTGGLYVAVSRRNDSTKWGLPGGKVDPGENTMQCVLRETREELGLAFGGHDLELVGGMLCEGEQNYYTDCFQINRVFNVAIVLAVQPEHGLEVQLLSAKDLCDPEISPFASYNKIMFEKLGVTV